MNGYDNSWRILLRVSEIHLLLSSYEHVSFLIIGGDERVAASYDGDGGDVRGRERDRGGGRAKTAKEIQAAHAQEDQVGRRSLQRQGEL